MIFNKLNGRLLGKVAFITGASHGGGAEIAQRFALEGATVVVADYCFEKAQEISLSCGRNSWAMGLDLTDNAAVLTSLAQITRRYKQLDFVINNSGINVRGGASDGSDAASKIAFDVNVKGIWRVMTAAWPQMMKQGFGKIINQSLCADHGGIPRDSNGVTNKSAIALMSEGAALSGSLYGIEVDSLCQHCHSDGATTAFLDLALRQQRLVSAF